MKARTAQPDRTARFDFRDDGSRIVVSITAKGDAKATIHIEHYRMSSSDDVEAMRTFWKESLARLDEVLKER